MISLFKSIKAKNTLDFTLSGHSVCRTILIGGEAGQGIKSAGQIVSHALLFAGFNVNLYDEYPSLIRGGHTDVLITFSEFPVYAPNSEIDVMVCIDQKTFMNRKQDLNLNSIVLYDENEFRLDNHETNVYPCEIFTIPVNKIIKTYKLPAYTKNTIYLCACLMSLGIDIDTTKQAITKVLQKKPDKLNLNIQACELTYQNLNEIFGIRQIKVTNQNNLKKKRFFLSGNECAGIGAIEARMGFYAAYPMTPASSLLDFMFKHYRTYNFIVKQTEDEIAAINMAIGAAFAGARSMVGTSGGGFSLMVEGLGLAAMTETPLVIFLAQRPGPSTGMPTWTAQSDLLFVLHASQDEFPRVVLTPTDHEELREMTFLAFNIAEKYQIPVFILSDKYLSESYTTITYQDPNPSKKIDRGLLLNASALARIENFKRYEFTNSGISARSLPGQINGIHLANSDESDEYGYSNETSEIRRLKMQKRFKKVENVLSDLPSLNVYGAHKTKYCIVTWGSTKGSALEAIRRLQIMNKYIKLVALNYVEPLQEKDLINILKPMKKIFLIESNYTGQLYNILSHLIDTSLVIRFNKYDGRPIFPKEIVDFILTHIES